VENFRGDSKHEQETRAVAPIFGLKKEGEKGIRPPTSRREEIDINNHNLHYEGKRGLAEEDRGILRGSRITVELLSKEGGIRGKKA